MEPHKKYLTDPGYTPGEDGKKPKISKKGRRVVYFYNPRSDRLSYDSYGVRYYTNWKYIYMYTSTGKLLAIEIREPYKMYPYVTYKYDTSGKLMYAVFWVSMNECYAYDLTGALIVHWICDSAYDENGDVKRYRLY